MVEIYEGVLRPQTVAKLIATDDLPGSLQEQFKNTERLFLKLDPSPVPAQLRCLKV
jgi:hypothetical protein